MRKRRAGIALFSALSLLALSGILVAGVLASSVMLGRTGTLAQTDAQLSTAAEYALATVIGDASTLGLARLSFGATTAIPVAIPGASAVHATVSVTRLASGRLWLVATAERDGDDARRRVNLVARFAAPVLFADAPLVSAGGVMLGSGVRFETDLAGERDCSAVPTADVVISPAALFRADSASLIRVAARAVADDSSTYLMSGSTWSSLAARSGVTYAPADLTLTGIMPAGVLLVGGRLTINGPFTLSGLIVARGGVEVRGAGSTVNGIVLSASRDTGAVKLTGITLRFSRCEALRALDASVAVRPVRERSWAELY